MAGDLHLKGLLGGYGGSDRECKSEKFHVSIVRQGKRGEARKGMSGAGEG
jgi:hypothetical protein